jgi:hypothetical protein
MAHDSSWTLRGLLPTALVVQELHVAYQTRPTGLAEEDTFSKYECDGAAQGVLDERRLIMVYIHLFFSKRIHA